MEEVVKKRMISLPEVKEILSGVILNHWIRFSVGHLITYQNLPRLNIKLQRK
tara:strand:+ start:187 stop:342 length:156 start_codon:yes stop_codon:yes gene_type:complete